MPSFLFSYFWCLTYHRCGRFRKPARIRLNICVINDINVYIKSRLLRPLRKATKTDFEMADKMVQESNRQKFVSGRLGHFLNLFLTSPIFEKRQSTTELPKGHIADRFSSLQMFGSITL